VRQRPEEQGQPVAGVGQEPGHPPPPGHLTG
jgi:hypothetical protein